MYIYHNHILSIPARLLYEDWGLMKYRTYLSYCERQKLIRSREGKGKGNEALLSYHDLPQWIKNICTEKLGDPNGAKHPNELEKYIVPDEKASSFFSNHIKPDGSGLKMNEQIVKATSCMILNAITSLLEERKLLNAKGNRKTQAWQGISVAVNALDSQKWKFKLPKNARALERRYYEYLENGYMTFIHKGEGSDNAASIKTEEQRALIEEILAHHNNLDDEQATFWYNKYAELKGWDLISASTMRNWRKKTEFYTFSGRKGKKAYDNGRKMLVKRTAPQVAMAFWTMDGWVAELLYQKTETNKKGHSVTTYTHRLTAVVVLDPSTKYIVGYSIGTHENPPLIKEALRNALNHTKELFGERYKPLQIQTDNYGKGTLTSLYEASTHIYTPAQVANAKAKVVEPFFGWFNKEYFQKGLAPNWSGFGIKSNNQPNMEWIQKNKHLIPDLEGCKIQLIKSFEADRKQKKEAYLQAWDKLPTSDRLPLSVEDYLKWFGEDTGFTNRLHHTGITPTILGEQRFYECFDHEFRMHRHENWLIKYDPDDLSQVLAINAKSRNGKLEEIVGTKAFLLEEQHLQPMALYDQKEGDTEQLGRIRSFNKEGEKMILERQQERKNILQNDFLELINPTAELEILQKTLITDSRGKHKDRVSESRQQMAQKILIYDDFEDIEEDITNNY